MPQRAAPGVPVSGHPPGCGLPHSRLVANRDGNQFKRFVSLWPVGCRRWSPPPGRTWASFHQPEGSGEPGAEGDGKFPENDQGRRDPAGKAITANLQGLQPAVWQLFTSGENAGDRVPRRRSGDRGPAGHLSLPHSTCLVGWGEDPPKRVNTRDAGLHSAPWGPEGLLQEPPFLKGTDPGEGLPLVIKGNQGNQGSGINYSPRHGSDLRGQGPGPKEAKGQGSSQPSLRWEPDPRGLGAGTWAAGP